MKRIDSVAQLRTAAAYTPATTYHQFYIIVPGKPPLSKHITWYADTNTYTIYHEIDDQYEEDLTEQQLLHDTHIADAIEKKILFKE